MPIATDPIGAIRKELIGAARRRAAIRRRRRRRVAVLAAGASMLVAVAGVSAVANLGTGVQPIDALLGVERGSPSPTAGLGDAMVGPSSRDLRAVPGSTSDRLTLPSVGDGRGAVGLAYLTVGGDICFAEADLGSKEIRESRGTVMGCWAPDLLARRLADETAVVSGSEFGDVTIVAGFTAPNVERLRVTSADGRFETKLTDVWTPNAPGAESLRVFVAVDRDGRTTTEDALDRAMDLRNYELVAELQGGQIVRAGP